MVKATSIIGIKRLLLLWFLKMELNDMVKSNCVLSLISL